jgi:hypothetical protein
LENSLTWNLILKKAEVEVEVEVELQQQQQILVLIICNYIEQRLK